MIYFLKIVYSNVIGYLKLVPVARKLLLNEWFSYRQVRTIETRLTTDIQTIMQLLSHIVAHSGGSLLGNTTTISKDLVSLSSDLTPDEQPPYRGKPPPRYRQYRRAASLQGSLSPFTTEGLSLRYMCRSLDLPRYVTVMKCIRWHYL